MGRFATASTTGRAFIDGDWSESVKKRVYLPEVDEFRSSSGPLSGVVLESLGAVSCCRAKPLKEGYVADLTREGGLSPCSVILGLLYIHRLTESNPRFLRTMGGKDLFLTAMMIASKYLNDEGESEALTNSEWGEVGCKSKPALDLMERKFLAAIDWKLYVSLEEYYAFVTGIESRIALNQFALRGWLTYTDLVTLWDAMDTQKALLTATKQVAKVTCGSAAVYLVLLSTLFTASHAIHSTWSSFSSSPLTSSPLSSPPSTTNTSVSTVDHPLMMKEPPDIILDIGHDTYNDSAHWKPHPHTGCVHPSMIPGEMSHVSIPSSPPSVFIQNGRQATLFRHTHGNEVGTFECNKRRCRCRCGAVYERGDSGHRFAVFGQQCDRMDRKCARSDCNGTASCEKSQFGTGDLIWPTRLWYVVKQATIPVSIDQPCQKYTSDIRDGNTNTAKRLFSDEWVNWLYLYSYFESLYEWFVTFVLLVSDFYRGLGPVHTGNVSFTDSRLLASSYRMLPGGEPLITGGYWDRGGSMAELILCTALHCVS